MYMSRNSVKFCHCIFCSLAAGCSIFVLLSKNSRMNNNVFHCIFCNVFCNNTFNTQAHLNSSKHAKNEREQYYAAVALETRELHARQAALADAPTSSRLGGVFRAPEPPAPQQQAKRRRINSVDLDATVVIGDTIIIDDTTMDFSIRSTPHPLANSTSITEDIVNQALQELIEENRRNPPEEEAAADAQESVDDGIFNQDTVIVERQPQQPEETPQEPDPEDEPYTAPRGIPLDGPLSNVIYRNPWPAMIPMDDTVTNFAEYPCRMCLRERRSILCYCQACWAIVRRC